MGQETGSMILKRNRVKVFWMVGLMLICVVSMSLASSTLVLAQDQDDGGSRQTEVTTESEGAASSGQYQYDQDIDITNIINIPDKGLPKTGGPPLLAILFSFVVGAGLLTAVVRRRF